MISFNINGCGVDVVLGIVIHRGTNIGSPLLVVDLTQDVNIGNYGFVGQRGELNDVAPVRLVSLVVAHYLYLILGIGLQALD